MATARTPEPRPIGRGALFVIFLKAGLAFGGGLGILAVLEDELVRRYGAIDREEFLAIYGLGRIVPSGTMTALAVAYGYRFGGLPGTAIALVALVLPAFVITVALTVAYAALARGPILPFLPVTILPAALAFIVSAALRLGKDLFRPSVELLLAMAGFAAAFFFGLNSAVLLILGGLAGAVAFGRGKGRAR